MPTYICEKCGCVDNSANGGNYWMIIGKQAWFKEDYANTHLLCTECTPPLYDDGSASQGGSWHNRSIKRHWTFYGTKEKVIEECNKNQGAFVNAVKYFKNNT